MPGRRCCPYVIRQRLLCEEKSKSCACLQIVKNYRVWLQGPRWPLITVVNNIGFGDTDPDIVHISDPDIGELDIGDISDPDTGDLDIGDPNIDNAANDNVAASSSWGFLCFILLCGVLSSKVLSF